jgi:predicted nuclease of predicted toxin-antitoxin system
MLKYLLDENIPLSFGHFLSKLGFQVEHISIIAKGSSDDNIINNIIKDNYIFITNDMDFGSLVFQYCFNKHSIGVILIRRVSNIHSILPRLSEFLLSGTSLLHKFIVIESDKIRIRQLPNLS